MKNKIIFLDTETTDIEKKTGMIQLGYIVCDLYFKEIKRENMFFDTDKDITIGSMAVHHITPKILIQKLERDPRNDEQKKQIAIEDFKDAYLIAHNSPFDKNVLTCNGIITNDNQWIDSYCIAYARYTEDNMKHSLQYLRYFMKLEFDEIIDTHDALSDVIVLKKVFEVLYLEYNEEAMLTGYEPGDGGLLNNMVEQTEIGIILRVWVFGKYKGQLIKNTFEFDSGYFQWMYNQKIQDGSSDDALFNTLKFYLNK